MILLEVKLLHGEIWFLHHLDGIIDRHPGYVALAVFYLFVLLMVLAVVSIARRHAKGLIKAGPRIIYVESSAPPPRPPEPPFDPFPPRRDVDYEIERLRDEGYLDD